MNLRFYGLVAIFGGALLGAGCSEEAPAEQKVVQAQAPTGELGVARACAERVLREDSSVSASVGTNERIAAMRSISTSGCSTKFRLAYLDHIHAWEDRRSVAEEVSAFNVAHSKDGDLKTVFVDTFGRTLAGDPFGLVKDWYERRREAKHLNAKAKQVVEHVRATFKSLESLAVSGG